MHRQDIYHRGKKNPTKPESSLWALIRERTEDTARKRTLLAGCWRSQGLGALHQEEEVVQQLGTAKLWGKCLFHSRLPPACQAWDLAQYSVQPWNNFHEAAGNRSSRDIHGGFQAAGWQDPKSSRQGYFDIPLGLPPAPKTFLPCKRTGAGVQRPYAKDTETSTIWSIPLTLPR